MGKNNQQRRAAKRRKRAANLASGPGGPHGASRPQDGAHRPADSSAPHHPRVAAEPTDPVEIIAGLIESGAILAFGDKSSDDQVEQIVQSLVVSQSTERDPRSADRLATERFFELIGILWENGWQPLDLVHIVRRHQSSRLIPLVVAVIGEQARQQGAATRAPESWLAQLRSLDVDVVTDVDITTTTEPTGKAHSWSVLQWQTSVGISSWDGWQNILRLLGQLRTLHGLTPLGPRPSEWDRIRSATDRSRKVAERPAGGGELPEHDPRMLSKIRALLSKAEATTFAEEADAFTAKAQDLMTRYAIDEALLEDSAGRGEVDARRVHIDNPYAQAKVQLLSTVGDVNRVRVVWDDHHGMATMVGMAVDLELVEMLFTSLLVQATRALTEVGNKDAVAPGYRSGRPNRSPSFRRAFLLAYASRIGERLRVAGENAAAQATSSHGAELVPVLARRTEEVDTEFNRLFPKTESKGAKRVDARGWHAGRAAADRAVLAAGQVAGG